MTYLFIYFLLFWLMEILTLQFYSGGLKICYVCGGGGVGNLK